MTTDSAAPTWWSVLPEATIPRDTDLCHVCGLARDRGCEHGDHPSARWHIAGLPADYQYDEAVDIRYPINTLRTHWYDIPPAYLRKYDITL